MHDWYGHFCATPQANESYQAVWTDAAGKQQAPLPEAKAQVENVWFWGNKKSFLINRTTDVPAEMEKCKCHSIAGPGKVYKAKSKLHQLPVAPFLLMTFNWAYCRLPFFSEKMEQ